jgi:hypothetical protein
LPPPRFGYSSNLPMEKEAGELMAIMIAMINRTKGSSL